MLTLDMSLLIYYQYISSVAKYIQSKVGEKSVWHQMFSHVTINYILYEIKSYCTKTVYNYAFIIVFHIVELKEDS